MRWLQRCRSRQIFWGAKDFFPNFPKLVRKVFCASFAYRFSPTMMMKTFFWCDLQKRFSCVCLQMLSVTQRWAPFSPGFQGFCPDFPGLCSDFQGCSCSPASSTSAATIRSKISSRLWRRLLWETLPTFRSATCNYPQATSGLRRRRSIARSPTKICWIKAMRAFLISQALSLLIYPRRVWPTST